MSILITGGLGFIGINTTAELLLNNKDVVIVDLPTSSPIIDFLQTKFNNKLKYYSVNLLNKELLDNIFSNNPDINTVIHCAGYKMANNNTNIPEYYQNNISTTLNLLDIMKKHNVKNFIFNSSANVYENCPDINKHIEDIDLPMPNNIYGQSKLFIEQILKDLCISDKSFNSTILRIYNPIGIHPIFRNNFDYDILKKFNHLPTIIAQVLTNKKEQLEIYINNNDNNLENNFIRDYIPIIELTKLYNSLADHIPQNYNIYNIGTGKGYSILELINIFEKISNKKVNYITKYINRPIISTSIANITKIKQELNYNPQESDTLIKSSCIDIFECFKYNK